MKPDDQEPGISWVLLTMGDRPELATAVSSVLADPLVASVVIVVNADVPADVPDDQRVRVIRPGENLGVPGGRDLGVSHTSTELVGFLDDDAELTADFDPAIVTRSFADDSDLGGISLRLVDEDGDTSRRHVPRVGAGSEDRSGPVVNFLGGASVLRRTAYDHAGGYWPELFYAHEELDLAWRMADRGWNVRYEAACAVRHPRTSVSRHPEGWFRTGRNRVMVARRNLPFPVMVIHTIVWLAAGAIRAGNVRGAYLRGWWSGWREPVERRPISWRTVVALTRLGRPPLL